MVWFTGSESKDVVQHMENHLFFLFSFSFFSARVIGFSLFNPFPHFLDFGSSLLSLPRICSWLEAFY